MIRFYFYIHLLRTPLHFWGKKVCLGFFTLKIAQKSSINVKFLGYISISPALFGIAPVRLGALLSRKTILAAQWSIFQTKLEAQPDYPKWGGP